MGSAHASDSVDDRTTKARIRDAAISCIAEHGVADTTARKVAAAAGVSPGLVMHHFGSMDGLRTACDQHLTAVIRHEKEKALASGVGFDVAAALRDTQTGHLSGYLAQVLVEGSAIVDDLVDELVADAERYLAQGVDSGMLKPSEDERGRASVLTIWSLGSLVLHRHVQRILGADLTHPHFSTDPSSIPLLAATVEILSDGVYTEAVSNQMRSVISPDSDHPITSPPDPGSREEHHD